MGSGTAENLQKKLPDCVNLFSRTTIFLPTIMLLIGVGILCWIWCWYLLYSVSTILFWSVACASMILLCRVFSASMILLCAVFSPSMILLCAVFSASGIHGARSQIWAQSTWQIWIMRSNVQVNNGYRSWNYHHSHNIEMCRWMMDIIVVGNYHHSHNIKCAGE